MSVGEKRGGCAACHKDGHGVRSCEAPEAVVYWFRRAVQEQSPELAAKYERRAANLERRLRGEPLPVGGRKPSLPRGPR